MRIHKAERDWLYLRGLICELEGRPVKKRAPSLEWWYEAWTKLDPERTAVNRLSTRQRTLLVSYVMTRGQT